MYELGLRCKEVREENFKPYLYFYLAGDFLPEAEKKKQIIFTWSFIYLGIDMDELFSQRGGLAAKTKWLARKFEAAIPGGKEQDFSNQYLFEEAWILRQSFNWEHSITVSSNRRFDQFCLINSPQSPTHFNNNAIYVNGPAFKSRITNGSLDVPFFVKLPNDAKVSHARNAIIKNELFYSLE